MKELSIEQKARRYDEAKYIMKEYLESGNAGVIAENTIKKAFPELSESEDEIVIAALKSGINGLLKKEYHLKVIGGISFDRIIAWLEKQGKNIRLPKFTFDDILALQCCMETTNKVQEDKELYEQLQSLHDRLHDAYWLEKQCDTKETLCDKCRKEHPSHSCQDITALGRCAVEHEQKPAEDVDLPEFESYLCLMFQKFRAKGVGTNGEIVDFVKEHSQKLKDTLCHVWSEEDDYNLQCMIAKVTSDIQKGNVGRNNELIDWLDSLKERVQLKQKGSKEDENNILFLTSVIEECFKDKEKITLCGDTACANFTKEDVIDRLKSLRPQSQWKPSDEQMNALLSKLPIIKGSGDEVQDILESLYQDLKKLREE